MTNSTAVRLHLTNVSGAGAIQLLQSLLPALEAETRHIVTKIYLPSCGSLASYRSSRRVTRTSQYRRYLPNAVSRLLECTLFGYRFNGSTPMLVLGDLPIRSLCKQTVFVQTPHLLKSNAFHWSMSTIKFFIMRTIFRLNLRYAENYIVQTVYMRDALIASYPALDGKVHVIPQPVPTWLIKAGLKRSSRARHTSGEKLKLIYPAASYPHKNHKLLVGINSNTASDWPVKSLQLTIRPQLNPAPSVPWIRCTGFLSSPAMVEIYTDADALLFLSANESYGFPLVEAMYVGLPIICPNLPYAKILCGNQAIYFDHTDIVSLRDAIEVLHRRLTEGWWPDWREQLEAIPSDWHTVASRILAVVDSSVTLNEFNS